jgi:hypothetical protein
MFIGAAYSKQLTDEDEWLSVAVSLLARSYSPP